MDITLLPFNAHVGIERAVETEYLLVLRMRECLTNHLGTVHASALYSLAEATSGEFLIQSLGARNDIGGVVRRSSSKYSRPAIGDVFSRVKTPVSAIESAIGTVDSRGRAFVDLEVELFDEHSELVALFGFTWLLAIEDAGKQSAH